MWNKAPSRGRAGLEVSNANLVSSHSRAPGAFRNRSISSPKVWSAASSPGEFHPERQRADHVLARARGEGDAVRRRRQPVIGAISAPRIHAVEKHVGAVPLAVAIREPDRHAVLRLAGLGRKKDRVELFAPGQAAAGLVNCAVATARGRPVQCHQIPTQKPQSARWTISRSRTRGLPTQEAKLGASD